MKIQFKHLAPYLPYELKVKHASKLGNIKKEAILTISDYNWLYNQRYFKPLLYPLSIFGDSDDLRIVHEFIGLGKWCEAYDFYFSCWFNDMANIDKLILQAPYEIFNYFLVNHYDVFGLIEQNLAIDKTTIKQ